MVRAICDRVVVMLHDVMVEAGDCEAVFAGPRHAYARAPIDAIPPPGVEPGRLDEN